MATYMVCDGDGYALTDGLQEHEARQVAQRMANNRLESVWLSENDSEGMGEEFEPSSVAVATAEGAQAKEDGLDDCAANPYVTGTPECLAWLSGYYPDQK